MTKMQTARNLSVLLMNLEGENTLPLLTLCISSRSFKALCTAHTKPSARDSAVGSRAPVGPEQPPLLYLWRWLKSWSKHIHWALSAGKNAPYPLLAFPKPLFPRLDEFWL